MKTIELMGVQVKDVGGVLEDLLKKDFDAESVGATANCTYIYLADDEEKDPRPIVEGWVGKQEQKLTREEAEERRKNGLALVARAKAQRKIRAEERAKAEAREKERAGQVPDTYFQTPAVEAVAAPAAAAAAPPKEKFLSKLFKVFRS